MDFDPLNSTVIDVFAEPVTFHAPAGDVVLQAVPEEEDSFENIGQVSFRDWRYRLMLKTADLLGLDIQERQTATFRGALYRTAPPEPELDGMTTIKLREYAA